MKNDSNYHFSLTRIEIRGYTRKVAVIFRDSFQKGVPQELFDNSQGINPLAVFHIISFLFMNYSGKRSSSLLSGAPYGQHTVKYVFQVVEMVWFCKIIDKSVL